MGWEWKRRECALTWIRAGGDCGEWAGYTISLEHLLHVSKPGRTTTSPYVLSVLSYQRTVSLPEPFEGHGVLESLAQDTGQPLPTYQRWHTRWDVCFTYVRAGSSLDGAFCVCGITGSTPCFHCLYLFGSEIKSFWGFSQRVGALGALPGEGEMASWPEPGTESASHWPHPSLIPFLILPPPTKALRWPCLDYTIRRAVWCHKTGGGLWRWMGCESKVFPRG